MQRSHVVAWHAVDSCDEEQGAAVGSAVELPQHVVSPQEHPMGILQAEEVSVHLVEAEGVVEAQPALQEADVLDAEEEDAGTEEQHQPGVHGQMAVHTHDNSNNNSPNTPSDHSNHAVVAEGGDMALEQEVVFGEEQLEEFWLLFPFVPFHLSPSSPFVVH